MHTIILFASGKGSNVQAILEHFADRGNVKIALIVCNNPDAGVLAIAERHHIPVLLINKKSFKEASFIEKLQAEQPALLILAGFMWKVPDAVVQAFPNKMINIHPALLPKYGGKGMYGHHVHHAVKEAKEQVSGITIHFVNEHYDEGAVILQAHCALDPGDDPEDIAGKVHQLEHFYFPRVIEFLLDKV